MADTSEGGSSKPDTARALDALLEVQCECGETVYVTRTGADRVWECHRCGRGFTIFLQTAPDGRAVAVPMFVAGKPPVEPKLPESPEVMMLLCTCGSPLKITRRLYNHRVQCPHCAVRLALLLTFDPKEQRYGLEARKIVTPSLGDTHVLVRSSF